MLQNKNQTLKKCYESADGDGAPSWGAGYEEMKT